MGAADVLSLFLLCFLIRKKTRIRTAERRLGNG